MDGDSCQRLIEQLQCGSADQAARDVFSRYTARLIALARKRLDRRIQQKEDPDDVVQSVFRSFFGRAAQGQVEVRDWDELWGLLALITARKCARRGERWTSQKRSIGQESQGGAALDLRALSREPTPEDAAALAEALEELMRPLSERERLIVSLRLQGLSDDAIADQAERSLYTVHSVLRRVEKRLRRTTDGPPAD